MDTILIDEGTLRDIGFSSWTLTKLIDLFGFQGKKSILESLREYYPDILDVDIKEDFIRIIHSDFSITFPSLPDGIKSFFLVSMLSRIPENGFVFIEEPENHLHPSLMRLYSNVLLRSVIDRKNKIFISTHSLDFLEIFLKASMDEGVDTRVFKITELGDGILEYKSYEGGVAYSLIEEVGRDIRL